MLRRCGRIVLQTVEGIIDPGCRERGQRHFAIGRFIGSVGDGIVHYGQVRQIKDVSQRPVEARRRGATFHMRSVIKGEMQRDRHIAIANQNRHLVVLHEKRQLCLQIMAEQVRPGDGRNMTPRPGDKTVGQAAVMANMAVGDDLNLRIKGPHPMFRLFPVEKRLEVLPQEGRVRLKNFNQPRDSFLGIAENLQRVRWRKAGWPGRLLKGSVDRVGHVIILIFVILEQSRQMRARSIGAASDNEYFCTRRNYFRTR
jgi:hypothetical protein